MLDLLSTKDIRCGGSFMIFNRDRDIVRILMNFANFFKQESCGICTPCRAGNFILQRKLEKLEHGLAIPSDITELKAWANLMKMTSRCGLGKTAPNSLITALEKFPEVFEEKLDKTYNGLSRKFDMETATRDYESYKS